jgi:hypothetical protein
MADAGEAAGTQDAGEASATSDVDGGCGCRVAGTRKHSPAAALLACVLFLAFTKQRTRSTRKHSQME